jgi:hypothetical protein
MGEANRRGTFEQRKSAGVARRTAQRQQRQEAIAIQKAAVTPEQRRAEHKNQMVMATMLGLAAMSGRTPWHNR